MQELLTKQPTDRDSSPAEQVGRTLVQFQASCILPEVTQYISQRHLSVVSQGYCELEVI